MILLTAFHEHEMCKQQSGTDVTVIQKSEGSGAQRQRTSTMDSALDRSQGASGHPFRNQPLLCRTNKVSEPGNNPPLTLVK